MDDCARGQHADDIEILISLGLMMMSRPDADPWSSGAYLQQLGQALPMGQRGKQRIRRASSTVVIDRMTIDSIFTELANIYTYPESGNVFNFWHKTLL